MSQRGKALPEGWDEAIPEGVWPEAMLSAVRRDVGALAAPRVIATLRAWQRQALDEADPTVRTQARRWLEALGRAIAGEPATDDLLAAFDPEGLATAIPDADPEPDPEPEPEGGTIDAFQLPPKPNLRREVMRAEPGLPRARSARVVAAAPKARRVSLVPAEEDDTDARVSAHPHRRRPPTTGASAPPDPAFAEDENPTTAFQIPEDKVPPPPPPPPPLPPEALAGDHDDDGPTANGRGPSNPRALSRPVAKTGEPFAFEEDDKPTRHIPLPDEVLLRRLDSAEAALAEIEPEASEPEEPERTQMAPYPPKPPSAPKAAPPRGPTPKVEIQAGPSREASGRLPPKPGVIRRSSRPPRDASAPRPRAAMHHVRTLHTLLHAFVEELVPLPYERRSRRFWARWREVAGDRGVRREFVEQLLETAQDGRVLLCELIAEVQSVDPASVYVLVDKLASEGPAVAAEPLDSASQPRGPLVGASVRVDSDDA